MYDFSLSEFLIESSRGLAESGLFLVELLLRGAGIELDDACAFFHGLTGRREPRDTQLGNDRRVNWDGPPRVQAAATTNDDGEIVLAGEAVGYSTPAWAWRRR